MYKHIIESYIIPYLQKFNYKVKKPLDAFDCPFCGTAKSAQVVPGSYGLNCHNCQPLKKINRLYNIVDVVKKLENKDYTEEEVYQIVRKLFDVKVITKKDEEDLEKYLNYYVENKFDLVPVAGNSKVPVEKNWTTKTHTDKNEWLQWLTDGLNLGMKCGKKSGITVIDIDQKPIPENIKKVMGNTLIQTTTKGFHLFYQYEPELPKTRIDNYKIDIENDGGQVVIYPSKIEGKERIIEELNPIIKMPNELKKLLLNKITIPRKTQSEQLKEEIETEDFKMELFDEGSRNVSLVKLGGVLRKGLNIRQTEYVLNVLNRHNKSPLPQKEVNAMLRKLEHYTKFDNEELAHEVLKYLKDDVEEASRNEIAMTIVGTNRGEDKKRIDKVLTYLIKEGYILKTGRSSYKIKKRANWKTELIQVGKAINFKMPYFYDIANFKYKDLILIGSQNKFGKTHIALNIIKKLVEEGITPYYLSLEPTSRFAEIALQLGLKEGDFKYDWCVDPEQIELEDSAITIIDWLCPKDFAKVDKLFMKFVEQLLRTNGILIVFMQLKEDGSWFSPNLVNQFPALGAKYIYDEETGESGQFIIKPIRDPKIKIKTYSVPCIYNWETKILERADEIQKEKNNE